MKTPTCLLLVLSLTLAACTQKESCDSNQAMNKLLALGKVQSRLVAKGGASGVALMASMAMESAPIAELIAQKKYSEACKKADEMAARYHMDLASEQKDMITIEQLAKDGGKGNGECSVEDAAKRQMEVHKLLQAEVDAGRQTVDVFKQFNQDTLKFGDLLTTNPSEACKLLDRVKEKYKL